MSTFDVVRHNEPLDVSQSVSVHIQFAWQVDSAKTAIQKAASLRAELASANPALPEAPSRRVEPWLKACKQMASPIGALQLLGRETFEVSVTIDWTPRELRGAAEGEKIEVWIDCKLTKWDVPVVEAEKDLGRDDFLRMFRDPSAGTPLHAFISIVEGQ